MTELRTIVAHVIQCPCVLDYQNRYPLGFVIGDKHGYAEKHGYRINDKKGRIELFFVPRFIFVICYIQKPIP